MFLVRMISVALAALLAGGCAVGTTRLNIEHAPLERVETKKQGSILVRQFVDKRKESHEYIGNKRNGFGMVLGHVAPQEGVNLEALLTKNFAEALAEAGYRATIQEAGGTAPTEGSFDGVVEGEITEFWLDLYMKVWHNMEVRLRLLDPAGRNPLWQQNITADQSNVLWVGATGEYEKVISESLTKALNRAALEFSGDEFSAALAGQKGK